MTHEVDHRTRNPAKHGPTRHTNQNPGSVLRRQPGGQGAVRVEAITSRCWMAGRQESLTIGRRYAPGEPLVRKSVARWC